MLKALTIASLLLLAACTNPTTDSMSVTEWGDLYGSNIEAIGDDLGDIAQAADMYDLEGVQVACNSLAVTIQDAQSDPAIPDPEVDKEWQAALTDLALGADFCIDGDFDLSATFISSGGTHIDTASDLLGA